MSSSRSKSAYELRSAKREDADFLWHLHEAALRPHVEKTWGKWDDTQQRKFFDRGFVPRETRVIMVEGKPAGRLDVSRSRMEFFLGLIEILPNCRAAASARPSCANSRRKPAPSACRSACRSSRPTRRRAPLRAPRPSSAPARPRRIT
ncbi:MAG: hypothetical protein WDM96_08830 [Lacunisphaera sp.]